MSLFQSTFLPTLKEQSDETEVRKMGLDLLKKINQLSDSTDESLASPPSIIVDARVTTGTVNRTETALPLEIGQISIIDWTCQITGGVARSISFALPDVSGVSDTYQVNLSTANVSTGTLAAAVWGGIAGGAVYGAGVAGGTSVAVNGAVASGTSQIIWGYVKRLT